MGPETDPVVATREEVEAEAVVVGDQKGSS
jgi:hypothetical protein